MINEKMKAVGTLSLVLRGPDGQVKQSVLETNKVVTGGLGFITSRMKEATAGVMSHMAVGTDATAEAMAQTALLAEVGRVALTSTTLVTTTYTNDSIQFVGEFPAGTGTGTLREAGILNNNTGGTMLSRTVYGAITKGAADSLTITWKVQLQSA